MKRKVVLKIVTFIVLNIFIFTLGAVSFAKIIPPDNINWNHFNSCGILFEESDDNYPYFYCGGSTSVPAGENAYVLIELQKLTDDPDEVIWETVYSLSDEDHGIALAEDEVEAEAHKTYRLKVTHQAKTFSGDVLEQYVHYSRTIVITEQD